MEKERWKKVDGFEDAYEVSDLGRVKSLSRWCGTCLKKESFLNSNRRLTKDGYPRVVLSKSGQTKEYRLNRLVAEHFIDNPHGKKMVNHKNGIKTDNRAENLEWMTREENMQHAYDNSLKRPIKGWSHSNSKLKKEDVDYIKSNFKKGSKEFGSSVLGRKFDVSHRTILNVIEGKTYNHKTS